MFYWKVQEQRPLRDRAGSGDSSKVIAITNQRIIIASGKEGLVLNLAHGDITLMKSDGRTLVVETRRGIEHKHRLGKVDTVQELVETARRQKHLQSSPHAGELRPQGAMRHKTSGVAAKCASYRG